MADKCDKILDNCQQYLKTSDEKFTSQHLDFQTLARSKQTVYMECNKKKNNNNKIQKYGEKKQD